MTVFDACGGPWGCIIKPGTYGFDVYFAANTWSNQPLPKLQGTIEDTSLNVGAMASGEVFICRTNWFNQGAHYRCNVENYPDYPNIATIDAMNLCNLKTLLGIQETVVDDNGQVNFASLFPLLNNPPVLVPGTADVALLALLSSIAATEKLRKMTAKSLGLKRGIANIFIKNGILLVEKSGTFSKDDLIAVQNVLNIFPDPVKNKLHLIILDDNNPTYPTVVGGFNSGGIITLSNSHANTLRWFSPYPNGNCINSKINSLQATLVHEMGHMMDDSSVGKEANRYDKIYNIGKNDPDAFLYGQTAAQNPGSALEFPFEEMIRFWVGYCVDSETVLETVAARGNAVLSQKLSHVIDLIPALLKDRAPFYYTDPATHVTSMEYVPATRGPPKYLGDDGMITSVNGTALFKK
jgi:hypothetical protein